MCLEVMTPAGALRGHASLKGMLPSFIDVLPRQQTSPSTPESCSMTRFQSRYCSILYTSVLVFFQLNHFDLDIFGVSLIFSTPKHLFNPYCYWDLNAFRISANNFQDNKSPCTVKNDSCCQEVSLFRWSELVPLLLSFMPSTCFVFVWPVMEHSS